MAATKTAAKHCSLTASHCAIATPARHSAEDQNVDFSAQIRSNAKKACSNSQAQAATSFFLAIQDVKNSTAILEPEVPFYFVQSEFSVVLSRRPWLKS